MPVSARVREIIRREMPGWRIVENPPRIRSVAPPDAVSPSIATMQRKYFGFITTLGAFQAEYPQLSPHVARERFTDQLNTRGAVLDENGKIIGFQG